MTSNPPSVSTIDDHLEGFHRARWVTLFAVGLMLAAGIVVLTFIALSQKAQITRQQTEIQSSCGFYRPLTGITPIPVPGTGKPSRLSVQIVAGSRSAYAGEHCQPAIGVPSPQLRRDEQVYRIRDSSLSLRNDVTHFVYLTINCGGPSCPGPANQPK
jgi:hypothetical protein